MQIVGLAVSADGFFIIWDNNIAVSGLQTFSFYRNGSTTETNSLGQLTKSYRYGIATDGVRIYVSSYLKSIHNLFVNAFPYSTQNVFPNPFSTRVGHFLEHFKGVDVIDNVLYALTYSRTRKVLFAKTDSFYNMPLHTIINLPSSIPDYTEGGLAVKDTNTMFVGVDSSSIVYRIDNYSVIKKVKSNYNIMNLVYKIITGKYTTFIYTIKDITGKYVIIAFVSGIITGKYNIINIITKILVGKYDIFNVIYKVITGKYTTFIYTIKDITGKNSIFNFISNKIIAKYSIFDVDPLATIQRMFLRIHDRQRPIPLEALD